MVLSVRAFALLGAVSIVAIAAFISPSVIAWVVPIDIAILLLAVADFWLSRSDAPVVRRELRDPVHQGEPTTMTLALGNKRPRRVIVRLRDVLAPQLGAEPVDHRFDIPARQQRILEIPLVPRWRGEALLAPPTIRVLGPMGLAWRTTTLDLQQRVRVYPRTHFDTATSVAIRDAMMRRVGFNTRQSRGISQELYALRDYVPGDEFRRIHWKQTARRRRPIVRETTWDQHQQIILMIDCGRPMASRAGPYTKLDHALAATLALMRVIVAQQDSATLVLFSKEVRRVVRVDRRTRSFAAVFERIYCEAADFEEPDYAEVAAWCARRIPRLSLVVLVTSVIDMLSAELVREAVFGLARRHRPLLVNLEDPAIQQLIRDESSTVVDAFAKASAMNIDESNRALNAQLRSQGIDVLTTPASRLTIGMLERYLEFKSRGYVHAARGVRVS